MTAQSRADALERRLSTMNKSDPRRAAVNADLHYWRQKALKVDARYVRSKRRKDAA